VDGVAASEGVAMTWPMNLVWLCLLIVAGLVMRGQVFRALDRRDRRRDDRNTR
jgi:hypothetical protein